ncbi:MAG: hypothetical protein H6556_04600 [Lewinellaceae bacterium]|nr:hypothetical protein [Lewinellaceae bacterium]
MYQSRLVKHIRELSVKDRERFMQFTFSPYFNQHEKTQELLTLILDRLDGPAKKMEKEAMFKALFKGEPYDEQQLHNVMSYLKRLYHDFLAYEQFGRKRYNQRLYTLQAAYNNHQFDILTNRSKQLQRKLNEDLIHDSEYYYTNYHLNNMLGYYSGHYFDRSETNTFQSMLDNLDKYYIVEKLRNCCHLTANSIMMNTTYNFRMLEELLGYLEGHWEDYKDDPTIVLYYTVLMSMNDGDNPEHYERMKRMLEKEMKYLSPDDGRDLYSFSYNYCIRMINAGDSTFLRELFNLYKQGLKQGLLLEKGMISEWDYKNIATLGCRLQEFEWTEDFLHNFRDKLPAHRQENAYNYNLGNLYYNKKMYNDALSALLLVQFTDVKYHLSTTFLLLRTYYALKDTEALLSLIETFRIYVIRNRKITTDQKRGYTNFLRFARRLVLLKHHASTYSRKALDEELAKLAQKVESTENVINKYWLLDECRGEAMSVY